MSDGEITPSPAMCLVDSMEDGHFRQTFDEALEDLIKGLHKHQQNAGGKAKGTLTIKIDHVYDGTHVIVSGEISTKMPKPVRGMSIYFRTPDNGLSSQHPKQLNLPLTDVTAINSSMKVVG